MYYSGLGLLAIGIYAAAFFVCWMLSFFLTKDSNYIFDNIFLALTAFGISSVPGWFLGKYLNEKNPLTVEEFFDGKRQTVVKPRHKIYSLAMEYWGFIFAGISFAALLGKKLGLF